MWVGSGHETRAWSAKSRAPPRGRSIEKGATKTRNEEIRNWKCGNEEMGKWRNGEPEAEGKRRVRELGVVSKRLEGVRAKG